jgi:hypothetical protein
MSDENIGGADIGGMAGILRTFEASVVSTNAALKNVEKTVQSLKTLASSLEKSTFGGGGSPGVGSMGLGSSGTNFLSGSFGSMSGLFNNSVKWGTGLNIASKVVGGLGGFTSGMLSAMPNVDSTIGMATGYYNAGVMSGGYSRMGLGRQTINGLGRGLTSAADAVSTAQGLTAMGIYGGSTSGLYGGGAQYNNILRATSGAARYLNIDNQTASQAYAGLYSGKTSMNLLQNFGVYTTNPNGGKSATPIQILAMMNNRLTGGGRMTESQVKSSLGPGGMLTADIQNSGLDETQQRLLRQYMLDSSRGKTWNEKTYGANLAKGSGGNPSQSLYSIEQEKTKTMFAAQNQYILGMKDATKAIQKFEGALRGFMKNNPWLVRANASVNTMAKDPGMSGMFAAGASIVNTGLGIYGAIKTGKALSQIGKILNLGGKGVSAVEGAVAEGAAATETAVVDTAATAGAGVGSAFLALPALLAAVGLTINGSSDITKKGTAPSKLPSAGQYLPGLTPVNTNNGSTSLKLPGGGGEGSVAGGTYSDANTKLKLIHPVGRAKIGTRYGKPDKLHPAGHHGVDFIVPLGTPVRAAADGKVTFAGGNAQNTMGTNNRTLGIQVIIDHGNGYSTVYGHLSSYNVSTGDQVKAGQQIGSSGNSGYSTGPHLHFELRKKGTPVDPSSALGGNYSAVAVGSNNSTGGTTPGDTYMNMSTVGAGAGASTLGFNSGKTNMTMPSAYSGASIGSVAASVKSMGSALLGVGGKANAGGAAIGSGAGGGADTAPIGKHGPVNITVNVASASEAEAKRLANIIKDYLEQDKLTNNMRMM